MRQRGGISPVLVNCVLEKVIRGWQKEMSQHNNRYAIKLGPQKTEILISCFCRQHSFVAENLEIAIKQTQIFRKKS